jgi:Rap1a immunity proteins
MGDVMRFLAAALLLCTLTTTANAYTGLDLLRDCSLYESLGKQDATGFNDPTRVMAFGRCGGYLQGIHDANMLVSGLKGRHSALYCSPEKGLETEQLILIVLDHLKKNPSKIHESARINIVVAMARAFPC